MNLQSEAKAILAYQAACLEAELSWRARVSLGTKSAKHLEPALSQEWVFSGNAAISVAITPDREPFVKDLQQSKNSRSVFYGYPIYVSRTMASGRWTISPILLFPISWKRAGNKVVFERVIERPFVNEAFLEQVFSHVEERQAFIEDLDLDSWDVVDSESFIRSIANSLHISFDGIIDGVLDPESVDHTKEIIKRTSIVNRPVITFAERQKFTLSTIKELNFLASQASDGALRETALGKLLAADDAEEKPRRLAQVCPLNEAQKTAVSRAFGGGLSVVTGPPGTGKSQVVLAILANAFLNGERALFTSRNNRAVDVVEERLNRIAGAPIALRVGSSLAKEDANAGLVGFLTDILNEAPSPARRKDYEATKQAFFQLQSSFSKKAMLHEASRRQVLERLTDLEQRFGVKTLEAIPTGVDLVARLSAMAQTAQLRSEPMSWLSRLLSARSSYRDALWLENGVAELRGTWEGARWPSTSLVRDRNFAEWAHALADIAALAEAKVAYVRLKARLAEFDKDPPLDGEMLDAADAVRLSRAAADFIRASIRSIPDRLDEKGRHAVGNFRAAILRLSDGEASIASRNALVAEVMREFPTLSSILPIWCVTNLSARNFIPLRAGLFDIAVIDEASQCDVASALPILYRAKNATIIGDPHQLRHISRITARQSEQIARRAGLSFEVLSSIDYPTTSLFDVASARTVRAPSFLADHFRSHPDIISFSNGYWYHDRLNVVEPIKSFIVPQGFQPGVRWIDVDAQSTKSKSGGVFNQGEAIKAVSLAVSCIKDSSFKGSVGIVSPFRAQASLITELIREKLTLEEMERHDLVVDTAHGFQGDERDVIVFSTCFGREMPESAMFFLKRTENLFNVAITRPRALLLVLGSQSSIEAGSIDYMKRFVQFCKAL